MTSPHGGTECAREALGRFIDERRTALLEEAHRLAYERDPQSDEEIASMQDLQDWLPD